MALRRWAAAHCSSGGLATTLRCCMTFSPVAAFSRGFSLSLPACVSACRPILVGRDWIRLCNFSGSNIHEDADGSGHHLRSRQEHAGDRKSAVEGKSGSVRVDLGGRGIMKKKKHLI